MASKKRYFIVNPAGAIHEVSYAHAKWRLKSVGWRMARAAEVKELQVAKPNPKKTKTGQIHPKDRGGHQVWDNPIATPWSPDPEPDVEPEAS